jgi:hypothetical protein
MKTKKIKKTPLSLAKFENDYAKEMIDKAIFHNEKQCLEFATLNLWSAVDKIIKHLEENEKA